MTRPEIIDRLYAKMAVAARLGQQITPKAEPNMRELTTFCFLLYDCLRLTSAYLEELEKTDDQKHERGPG